MLTERRQQQALADLIQGLQPTISPEQLTEPYLTLWREVCHLLELGYDRHDLRQELFRFKLSDAGEPFAHLVDTVLALEPGQKNSYTSLAELGPGLPQTRWFWPQWLPRGLLTLLAAWPGIGKTYLALDLARRVVAGLPAPDEAALDLRSGVVVYVDAEDFLPDIYERASVWRMPLDRFYPFRRPPRDLIDMSQAKHQDALIEMCFDLKPDLVIIDSLSVVNSRGENNIEDVREVLGFFTDLAASFDLALLLIHHLRKPGKGFIQPVTMHDLRGHGHLVAMARSILSLDLIKTGPEENPNGPRLLKVLKKNRGQHPQPLAVHYRPSHHNPDVAVLQFGPLQSLAQPVESQTDEYAQWLLDLLEEKGPLQFKEIVGYAEQAGYRRWVVAEARQQLDSRIVDTVGPRKTGNQWALADEDSAAEMEVSQPSTLLVEQCTAWLLVTLASGPLSYRELKARATEQGFNENLLQKARQRCPRIIDTLGARQRGNRWLLVD